MDHNISYHDLYETSDLNISVSPFNAGEITISDLNVPEYPWTAEYFNEVPINITAIAYPGYTFSHWEGVFETEPGINITLDEDLDIRAIFIESSDEIFINELMAMNENTIADESGEFDDWIEL